MRLPWNDRQALAALVVLTALILLLWSPSALVNGDDAIYYHQARNLDFSERTVHIGYLVPLAAVTAPLPVLPDRIIHLLHVPLGVVAVALLFLIARRLDCNTTGAFVAALGVPLSLIAAALGRAEVEAALLAALLFALWAWLAEHPWFAGAAAGVAFLVSPSALVLAPAFAAFRPRWRQLIHFAVSFLVVSLAGILPVQRDWFHGPRGVLAVGGERPGLMTVASKEVSELLLGPGLLLPLVAIGLLAMVAKGRYRLPLAVAACGLVGLALEMAPDVAVQLPTWLLLFVAAGFGVDRLLDPPSHRRSRLLPVAATCGAALVIVVLVLARTRSLTLDRVPMPVFWIGMAVLLVGTTSSWVARIEHPQRAAASALLAVLTAHGLIFLTALSEENRALSERKNAVTRMAAEARGSWRAVGTWTNTVLLEHWLFNGSISDGNRVLRAPLAPSEARRLEAWISEGHQIWLLGELPEVASRLEEARGAPEPRGPFLVFEGRRRASN